MECQPVLNKQWSEILIGKFHSEWLFKVHDTIRKITNYMGHPGLVVRCKKQSCALAFVKFLLFQDVCDWQVFKHTIILFYGFSLTAVDYKHLCSTLFSSNSSLVQSHSMMRKWEWQRCMQVLCPFYLHSCSHIKLQAISLV